MTAYDSKSCLSYLNMSVDQYNNTYHHSPNKKPINADYLLWLKQLRHILKLPTLKLLVESKLLSIRILLKKAALKIGQEKYLLSNLFLKLIHGNIKSKI